MLRALLPAVAIAISAAMGLAFRLWFWDTERIIVAMVILGIPVLFIAFATAFALQQNEILHAPRRGAIIGSAAGVALALGVLVPYAVGSESCDDTTADMSCEGVAALSLMVLGAGGATAGAISGVAVWLFHDLFLARRFSQTHDER